jgi:hypothetical protein
MTRSGRGTLSESHPLYPQPRRIFCTVHLPYPWPTDPDGLPMVTAAEPIYTSIAWRGRPKFLHILPSTFPDDDGH